MSLSLPLRTCIHFLTFCVATYNAGFIYDPSSDFLGQVGDFAVYTATFPGDGALLVSLVFEETKS